jgi:hypothetical protein
MNNDNHISRSEDTVTMINRRPDSSVTLDTASDCGVVHSSASLLSKQNANPVFRLSKKLRTCSTPQASFMRQYFTLYLPLHSILLQSMHVYCFFFLLGSHCQAYSHAIPRGNEPLGKVSGLSWQFSSLHCGAAHCMCTA